MRWWKIMAVVVSAIALTGCVIIHDEERPGDISFTWDFAGRGCSEVRGEVENIYLLLDGPTGIREVANYYPCNSGGYDGIKLSDFEPGEYHYTIDARDGDYTVYTASGTIYVDGDVSKSVSLRYAGNPLWNLTFEWRLFNGDVEQDCETAQMDTVELSLFGPSERHVRFACGEHKATVYDLEPGEYEYDLTIGNSHEGHTIKGKVSLYSDSLVTADFSW
jgi:hypothetical protein